MSKISEQPLIRSIGGDPVPALGFGTWQLRGETLRRALGAALEVGYRHIDTARGYDNEADIGAALADSAVEREALFLTSKVWFENLSPDGIRSQVESSLKALRTEYLDLALIHWPNQQFRVEPAINTLKHLMDEGKVRHIGVSNFNIPLFEIAFDAGPVSCVQVEYHCFLSQDRLLHLARNKHVLLTAYSPLAHGLVHGNETLREIGRKHGKSAAQVGIRWLLEQDGVATIPRSADPEHIQSNFEVFDFALDAEDLAAIGRLPKDRRQIDPDFAPDWSA